MEQKGNKPRKELSLKEQKEIVKETYIGGLDHNIGFNGHYTKNGKECGGASFLQLDGSYGPNCIPSIEFTPEILSKINSRK